MGQIFDHRQPAAGVSRLPRTACKSVGERWRDGAGSLPDLGYLLTPIDACKHVGHKRSTRPILTIEKRRCDCAGGRAQAARVSESDDAPGQAVCRLRRFGIRALQHAPGACTHECNSHFSTLMRTHSVRDASRLREGLFPWTAWEA
jgi:hypothetical protein